jgi:SAM-dependent methyltransferase
MQYEPIKKFLGAFISGSPFIRKLFYRILDLILLRAWHVRKTLRKINRELSGPANILDAGSGLGQYSWLMSRMNKDWRISGVDIDNEQIEGCKTFFRKTGHGERISFRTADLTAFKEPDAYDMILSIDVMEHIVEDERVFLSFYESLKRNGILIISTPSDRGGSDMHDDEGESFIAEHVRNGYSITEITDKLTRAGFSDIEAYYTYGKPGNISWHLTMKYPVKMLNISYIFFIILPFYYLVSLPVSIILNIFDLALRHKTGTGLLVTARKLNE